jgi:hypothetical protein
MSFFPAVYSFSPLDNANAPFLHMLLQVHPRLVLSYLHSSWCWHSFIREMDVKYRCFSEYLIGSNESKGNYVPHCSLWLACCLNSSEDFGSKSFIWTVLRHRNRLSSSRLRSCGRGLSKRNSWGHFAGALVC